MTWPLPIRPDPGSSFAAQLARDGRALGAAGIETLQLNLGKLCNLACHHCHVESGPGRVEIMTRATMEKILGWLDRHRNVLGTTTVDLTGGAPEMNPEFRWLVAELHARKFRILDRCNLTILLEPGYEDLGDFLASAGVEIVASLPCYLEANVDRQRGRGTYNDSIEALRRLNAIGYGVPGSGLKLDLVYNPTDYSLPGAQPGLEQDYKRELATRFGISFNSLWTITNMPIRRFEHSLKRDGVYDTYIEKLIAAHNPANVERVMCRTLVSVGWQGSVYDCDFNQMLQLPIDGPPGDEASVEAGSRKLWQFDPRELVSRSIRTGVHCFGCTAGAGSSCTGALS